MRNNTQRLAKAIRSLYDNYVEKNGCLAPEYKQAACSCTNALQMWRGPKGEKGEKGDKGDKGDNAGSFLVSAEFVKNPSGMPAGSYLKLVLIDVAQQEQVVYVDLSELTDIYEAGDGVSITDMVVAARLGAGLRFDEDGNIESAYQFCRGLAEDGNTVEVSIDENDHILGFSQVDCAGLKATVDLTESAEGTALVLTGRDGAVLGTVPLVSSDGIEVRKLASGGFTWIVDAAGLVSEENGNSIVESALDGKLYSRELGLSYTYGEGRLSLIDRSGTEVYSVIVPTMVQSLESAELVCEDEPAAGKNVAFASSMGDGSLYVPVDGSAAFTAAAAAGEAFSVTVGGSTYSGTVPAVLTLPDGITVLADTDGIRMYGPQASAPRRVELSPNSDGSDSAVTMTYSYPDDRFTLQTVWEGDIYAVKRDGTAVQLGAEPVQADGLGLSWDGEVVAVDVPEADMSVWPSEFDRADLALTFLKDDGTRFLQNVPLDCMTDALKSMAHPVALQSVTGSFSCGHSCSSLDDFHGFTKEVTGNAYAYASWEDGSSSYNAGGSVPYDRTNYAVRNSGTNLMEEDIFHSSGHIDASPADYPYLGYSSMWYGGVPAARAILAYAVDSQYEYAGPFGSQPSGYGVSLHRSLLVCRHDKAEAGATVEYENVIPLVLAGKPDGEPYQDWAFGVRIAASITYDAADASGKIPGYTVNEIKTTFYGLGAWCANFLAAPVALTLTSTQTNGTVTDQTIDMSCLAAMMDDAIPGAATSSEDGLMSADDKKKLDGLSQYPRITEVSHFNTPVYNTYYPAPAEVNFIDLQKGYPTEVQFEGIRGIRVGTSNGTWLGSDDLGNRTNRVSVRIGVTADDFIGDGLRASRGIISVPEYDGATASADGTDGLVPAATSAEKDLYLKGDGTWGSAVVGVAGEIVQSEGNHPAFPFGLATSDSHLTFGSAIDGKIIVSAKSDGEQYSFAFDSAGLIPQYDLSNGVTSGVVYWSIDTHDVMAQYPDYDFVRIEGSLSYYDPAIYLPLDCSYDVYMSIYDFDMPLAIVIHNYEGHYIDTPSIGETTSVTISQFEFHTEWGDTIDEDSDPDEYAALIEVFGTVTLFLKRESETVFRQGFCWRSPADVAGGTVLRLTVSNSDGTSSVSNVDLEEITNAEIDAIMAE